MTDRTFLSAIQNNQQLIADGATGSTLMSRGLPGGVTAEKWVLENPEMIIQLHKDFITAGSNIILTSTFSSTLYHLRGTSLEGRVAFARTYKGILLTNRRHYNDTDTTTRVEK